MKKLALVWIALLLYPVFMTSVIMRNDGAAGINSEIFNIAAAVCSVFSGSAVRFILYRTERKYGMLIHAAQILTGAVLINFASVFLCGSITVAGLTFTVLYLAGLKLYEYSVSETVRSAYVLISSVLYFFTAVGVRKYIAESGVFSCYIVPYIIMMLMWFILNNSGNISRMMTARNYDEKYLPVGIRKYNLFLSGVICAVTAFILLFYKQMAGLLSAAGRGIGKLVIYLFSLKSDEISEETAEVEETAEKIEQTVYSSDNSDILQIIFIIFSLTAAVLILVYAYRMGVFSNIARGTVSFFRKLFGRRERKKEESDSLGFTDDFEYLTDSDENFSLSESGKIKEWKHRTKKYNSMPDSREKLRFGYKLITEWIGITDPSVRENLTPYEISEKIKNDSLSESTGVYCKIRYGDAEYDSTSMNQVNSTLYDCIKDSKNIFKRRKNKK